ncbi:hypothetical protein GCM10009662_35800 [Catellatospora coxensis]
MAHRRRPVDDEQAARLSLEADLLGELPGSGYVRRLARLDHPAGECPVVTIVRFDQQKSIALVGDQNTCRGREGRQVPVPDLRLALDPQHVAARNNLAVEQLRTGRYTAGGRTLIDALAQDPQHELLHRNLGQAGNAWLSRLADGAVLAWLCWAAVLLTGSPRDERIAGGALAVLVAGGVAWSYVRLPGAMRRLVRRPPSPAGAGRIVAWACVAVPFVALLLRPFAGTPAGRGVAAGVTLFAVIAAFVTASRAYTRVLGAAARLHRRWRHRVFLRRGPRPPDAGARRFEARYTALQVVAIGGRIGVALVAVGVVAALILRPRGEPAPPPTDVLTGRCLTSSDGGPARPGLMLPGQAQLVACDDARAVYRVTGILTLPSTGPDGPQSVSCGNTPVQTVMMGWHDGTHVVTLCLTDAP